MSLKIIILSCVTMVVLGSVGYGIYRVSSSKHPKESQKSNSSTADEKITGKQADEQNVEVNSALIDPSPRNFSNDPAIINAGYTASVQVSLYSSKKMTKVAMEELKVNNLNASGDCKTSDKKANVATYTSGVKHVGSVSFKLTCRTGVTYTQESVLSTIGTFEGSKLLSYGGLTPQALTRSISFDVAVQFDDGTMTKKSFTGNINGQTLSNGDFGAGTLSGEKEKF